MFNVTQEMKTASRVNLNANLFRIADVFRRAKNGEKLTVGCIGGSITQGSLADNNFGYEKMMRSWWEKTFPLSEFTFVNAGIGGTDSHFGVYRMGRDLLSFNPDFVIVEFSVNDTDKNLNALTYECLIRKILLQKNAPAVMLLFMTKDDGTSLSDVHIPIGKYYNLPMVSYKDAILPVIKNADISWADISPDDIHPNSFGHKIITDLICSYFEEEILQKIDTADKEYILPSPKTEKYINADLVEFANFDALTRKLKNFIPGAFDKKVSIENFKVGLCCDLSESGEVQNPMEFDVFAQNLSLYYEKTRLFGGKVKITVSYMDENFKTVKSEKTVDTDFSDGWGDYIEITEIFSGNAPENLHIKIEPIYNSADKSKNKFSIFAFGISF